MSVPPQIILQSLKKASPLLVNVGLFVAFAMLLFSIIGVQAFRGSYLRHCVWIGAYQSSIRLTLSLTFSLADPQGLLANVTADQPCGGYVDADGVTRTYQMLGGLPSTESPKGFICGPPSICAVRPTVFSIEHTLTQRSHAQETGNPVGGSWSFDNILAALMQVTVTASCAFVPCICVTGTGTDR